MTSPVRVVKVGGSLLRHQPEAPAKETAASLMKWIARQSSAVNVLVAGGGEFAEAIRINPRFAPAHYNLGMIFRRQRKNEDAAREFSAALSADPQFRPARQALDQLKSAPGQ